MLELIITAYSAWGHSVHEEVNLQIDSTKTGDLKVVGCYLSSDYKGFELDPDKTSPSINPSFVNVKAGYLFQLFKKNSIYTYASNSWEDDSDYDGEGLWYHLCKVLNITQPISKTPEWFQTIQMGD